MSEPQGHQANPLTRKLEHFIPLTEDDLRILDQLGQSAEQFNAYQDIVADRLYGLCFQQYLVVKCADHIAATAFLYDLDKQTFVFCDCLFRHRYDHRTLFVGTYCFVIARH